MSNLQRDIAEILSEGREEEIVELAEDSLQEMANEDFARGISTIGDMDYLEYGEYLEPGDLWYRADIGYVVAINGDIVLDGEGDPVKWLTDDWEEYILPPDGFVQMNTGGIVYGGDEAMFIDEDHIVNRVAHKMVEDYGPVIAGEALKEAIRHVLYGEFDLDREFVGIERRKNIGFQWYPEGGEVVHYGNPDKVYEEYLK